MPDLKLKKFLQAEVISQEILSGIQTWSRLGINNLSDDEVVEAYTSLVDMIVEAVDFREKLEYLIMRHLEAIGATAMRGEDSELILQKSLKGWDYGKLAGLREMFSQEDLSHDNEGNYSPIYQPESEEMKLVKTPEKWDMGRGKRLLKYGREVEDIIESAREEGNPRITVKKSRKGSR